MKKKKFLLPIVLLIPVGLLFASWAAHASHVSTILSAETATLSDSELGYLTRYIDGSFLARPPWKSLDEEWKSRISTNAVQRLAQHGETGERNLYRILVENYQEEPENWQELKVASLRHINLCGERAYFLLVVSATYYATNM